MVMKGVRCNKECKCKLEVPRQDRMTKDKELCEISVDKLLIIVKSEKFYIDTKLFD